MLHREASGLVGDYVAVEHLSSAVDTPAESAAEQTDAHDAEQKPEDEADECYVENGRNRLDQRVHDHLQDHTSTCR